MKNKKIILVRHAETTANEEDIIAGSIDVDLTKKGDMQRRKVGKEIATKYPNIQAIYSSDLKRAYKTAQGIKNEFKNIKIEKDKKLREVHFGIAEGITLEELSNIDSSLKEKWLKHGYPVDVPMQETREEAVSRIKKEIIKICEKEKNKDTICLVTHGMLIKLLVADILNLGEDLSKLRIINNTEYLEVYLDNESNRIYM